MERPSPVPPKRRVVDESACANGWNSRARCSSRQADAGVGDRDGDLRVAVPERLRAGVQRDAPALGELDRVAEQVEQHLAHAGRIADQRVVRAGVDVHVEREALDDRLLAERAGDALDQAGQRERGLFQLQPAGLDLGEVEHVVDDAQQRLRRIADGRDGAPLRAVEALALQHVDHAEHAVHRRADLVAHGGEEGRLRLVRGFGLGALLLGGVARAFGCLLGGGERFLAALERGDVAVDAEQAAVAQAGGN